MATATRTITDLVTKTVFTSGTPSSTVRAAPQGGILDGGNPSKYDPKNPIILFIIQAAIVIVFTRLLHFPLQKLRQPRVIAEVITGIILGPSIMGRIPGFTNAIFPTASMNAFSLAANIGLVLFLFLVGLEADLRYLASNWRIALSVGAAGMALPFGLGAAIAYGLYHQFHNDPDTAPISFGVYMLFIGVATAITAFPVLCRILTSLKLLHTPVGVIVLSAGVANDVVGWILLALCVTLVNSSTSLTALWIFLVAIGYTLALIFIVRPAFMWILRRTGSLANGPTQSVVALTVLMVLASAFFTGVIGIHPIFGAFMIGLMAPHEGGFAIKLTEKLEDLVSVLFLPLYFALSGLSTNLGLLDNSITWAYVIGVIAVAFFGKVAGGTIASRLNGLVWRESLTIGCLMSCKGLVELIVLNIGLQAKILSTRTFTIFVVMALVTTVATTPLTMALYPPWYRRKLELWKTGKIDWEGNLLEPDNVGSDGEGNDAAQIGGPDVAKRVLVYLRLDGLPSLFTLVTLLGGTRSRAQNSAAQQTDPLDSKASAKAPIAMTSNVSLNRRPMTFHALRLLELTERNSSVMKVSELESYTSRDPIIKAFRTFAHSHDVAVGGQIAVVPEHSFGSTLVGRARDVNADLVVVPWSETGGISESSGSFDENHGAGGADLLANREYGQVVEQVFERSHEVVNVGVWLDKSIISQPKVDVDQTSHAPGESSTLQLSRTATGFSVHSIHRAGADADLPAMLSSNGKYNIVVFFSGSDDDLLVCKLAMQLQRNDRVHLQVLDGRESKDKSQGSSFVSSEAPDSERLDAAIQQLQTQIGHERVSKAGSTHAVLDAVTLASESAETIVIVGRDVVHGTHRDEVLGVPAMALVSGLRQRRVAAGILVLQGKKEVGQGASKPERNLSRAFDE